MIRNAPALDERHGSLRRSYRVPLNKADDHSILALSGDTTSQNRPLW